MEAFERLQDVCQVGLVLLHRVLGLRFLPSCLGMRWVQQRMLPNTIRSIAVESLHHLKYLIKKMIFFNKLLTDFSGSINTLNCDGIHAPRLRDLILEMWRPKLLCTLQHSSHNKIPRFMEAHVGSEIV
jgi:hypothetical protein